MADHSAACAASVDSAAFREPSGHTTRFDNCSTANGLSGPENPWYINGSNKWPALQCCSTARAARPTRESWPLLERGSMGIRQLLAPLVCCGLCTPLAASTGPDDRPLTDPKSVVSSSNAAARPAPIDDLYFTKSVFGAAWSPDGKQIVFTSDIAGRSNLWKVRASGGWPIQLTQSDERQYNAAWSPDGKWIVYQQDHAGDELWDLYAVPSDGGQIINLTNTPDIREENPR